MSPFPRPDYRELSRYHFDRSPVDVDLSDNTNQWGAHPDALAALRDAVGDGLARYPDLYARDLREAAAERLGVSPENISTGCGSDDVLDSAYRAAAGADDAVALAVPTFSMAAPLARMNGMRAVPVPWAEALSDPDRLFAARPALVYVCRPNNPTGHLAPRGWVEEVLDRAERTGALVIVDEAYVDFGADSLARHACSRSRVLVTRTLSKAYGLAGMRIGYAVGAAETVLEVEKSRGPYKVSVPAAAAGAAALRDASGWVDTTVRECVAMRDRLTSELAARGLEPLPSSANFVLFRAPGGDAGAGAAAMRRRGVAVRPFPGALPDGGDGLRVTVAPPPLMDLFLRALDGALEEVRP